eukprot:1150529-Pelagomonas_calceolata.AAC.4
MSPDEFMCQNSGLQWTLQAAFRRGGSSSIECEICRTEQHCLQVISEENSRAVWAVEGLLDKGVSSGSSDN